MKTWNLHPILKVVFTLLIISALSIASQTPFLPLMSRFPEFFRSRGGLLLMQAVSSAISFIGGAWLCAWLFSPRPSELLPAQRVKKRVLGVALGGFLCALPTVSLLQIWNESMTLPAGYEEVQALIESMEKAIAETTATMVGGTSVGALLVNLLVIALIPAIGEEMTFRGVMQRTLQQRYGLHTAVWATAILFSTAHYQFMGFFPRALLGLLLGYTAAWTGSLRASTLLHFANNALVVIGYWLCNRHGMDIEAADNASNALVMQGVYPALALFCGTLMAAHYLRMRYAANQSQSDDAASA